MPRLKTNTQIEVVVFKKTPEGLRYLMLHRVPARGGFWQPLTGGLEEGEQHLDTLKRELREETSLTEILAVVDPGYGFDFEDDGKILHEYVYGAEVSADSEVKLSHEHDEFRWVAKEPALTLLKYETNKIGLEKVAEQVEKKL